MDPFAQDYLNVLEKYHNELASTLDGLPAEALDWSPGPEMNSLAVLVVHATGSERYWLRDVIQGIPSGRDREAEFRTQGRTVDALKAILQEATALAREVLMPLSRAEFEVPRLSPRDGRQVTAQWALMNTLAHMASHAGHASLTRQLWEQQQAGRS